MLFNMFLLKALIFAQCLVIYDFHIVGSHITVRLELLVVTYYNPESQELPCHRTTEPQEG
jgi:hypothetical protein